MPTPPKPFTVLQSEKKSHRTKKELNQRKKEEDALSTGIAMKVRPEVKNNPVAYKEFKRVNMLLKNISKNDAINEIVINRYCLLVAECDDMQKKRDDIYEQTLRFEKKLDELGSEATIDDLKSVTDSIGYIYGTMISIDKQLQSKRKMLLDIEKENIMTIAAALRSIPKGTETKKNALLEALGGD